MGLASGQLAPDHQNKGRIEQDLVGDARRMEQGTGEVHRREMAVLPRPCKSLPLAYNPALLIRTARRRACRGGSFMRPRLFAAPGDPKCPNLRPNPAPKSASTSPPTARS